MSRTEVRIIATIGMLAVSAFFLSCALREIPGFHSHFSDDVGQPVARALDYTICFVLGMGLYW